MKKDTLITIEKEIGIKAWQFVDVDKFMEKSVKGDSLKDSQSFINLLIGNIGEIARYESYKQYGSKERIELQLTLSDCLMILFNLIKSYNFSILDILRIGLYRYHERIWEFKKR